MPHPLAQFSPSRRKAYFIPFLTFTILLMLVMNFAGRPLYTTAAPSGIISFEFAFSPGKAQVMLDSWDSPARMRASFIQGLDFLFPPVYSTTVALGCLMAASVLRTRSLSMAAWGGWLAWGQWLAALFDYTENIGLVLILFGVVRSPLPEIAGICAALKFALLLIGIVYASYGLAARVLRKSIGDDHPIE